MASQLLRTGIFVLGKMLVQIRQHFQAAVNEIHQIYHMFNAILPTNPVSIQRPEGFLFIVVGLDGPAQLICRALGFSVLKKSRRDPDAVQLT